jgi:hypothetical protein
MTQHVAVASYQNLCKGFLLGKYHMVGVAQW